jgi:DNA-binding IclR family transcriptional regulator
MPATKVTDEIREHYVGILKDCSNSISQDLGYEYQKI